MACAPQRFLCNNRNLLREAALTATSVLAVENQVRAIPVARGGTGEAVISGAYAGQESATVEIEILDDDVDERLISAPVFTGRGSGRLTDIETDTAQQYTLELRKAGTDAVAASIEIEGVTVRAREAGAAGNALNLTVDRSGLVFALSTYSTLSDIAQGGGGATSPLIGPGFDWDSKPLAANGQIALDAHRIAFGFDRSAIHLAYKVFADGEWRYHLVPAATRSVPAGTPIYFVTGGRTVTITDGMATETFEDIVTAYDLLNGIKSTSALVTLDGVVANDRTPTGQAARELTLRTDAHAELSTGSGSKYAQLGLETLAVGEDALTELVTATCIAVAPNDHPLAALGHERWALKGSLSGDLGIIVTGQTYSEPNGRFALRIPVRLPPGFGTPKGRIGFTVGYASRGEGESEPPICPYGALGPAASDKTITFTYTARPSGDCNCASMPVPNLGGRCLGNQTEEAGDMAYEEDTRERLKSLYDWYRDVVRENSAFRAGAGSALEEDFLTQPPAEAAINFAAQSLQEVVDRMKATLLLVDPLEAGTGTPRGEACLAWDDAFQALQDDITAAQAVPGGSVEALADENVAESDFVNYYLDDGVYHARKAFHASFAAGFAAAAATAGNTVVVKTHGRATGLSSLTPGEVYSGKYDGSGDYETPFTVLSPAFLAISATELVAIENANDTNPLTTSTQTRGLGAWLLAVPSDRYTAAMAHVLACAGLDPSGESDASILQSGDGCWRDYGDAAYWLAEGYAPVFSNRVGYLSRINPANGKYFSTREAAFFFAIKCPSDLKIGDTITVSIDGASWGATFQLNDEIRLPIVGAGAQYLAGGDDGDPTQEWYLTRSVDGPAPPYLFDPDAPAAYGEVAGLAFLLVPGGVPFAAGDKFTWSAEGGHFRWRKDGGAWDGASPPLAISATPQALSDGLSVAFLTGSARSFVAGDTFTFRARQPWALSNLRTPTLAAWRWGDGSPGPELEADLGSVQPITMVALVHDLPDGATLLLEGGDAAANEWSESITVLPYVAWKALDRTARYLKLTLGNADGGSIAWAWAGEPWAPTVAADMQMSRSARILRAADGGGGRFAGRALSGQAIWSEGASNVMPEADADELAAIFEHVKANDDEPIVIVPQITRTDEEAIFARIATDELEIADIFGYQPNAGRRRLHEASLPLAGVLR